MLSCAASHFVSPASDTHSWLTLQYSTPAATKSAPSAVPILSVLHMATHPSYSASSHSGSGSSAAGSGKSASAALLHLLGRYFTSKSNLMLLNGS